MVLTFIRYDLERKILTILENGNVNVVTTIIITNVVEKKIFTILERRRCIWRMDLQSKRTTPNK